jgi:hypothetical protein
MSLFGFVWAGFAFDFVIRFPFLCWDSFTFGNMSSRTAEASTEQVNFALFVAVVYFACLVGAYRLGRDFIATRILKVQVELPAERSQQSQQLLALLATAGIVLSSGLLPVPLALFTPLGILGSFWVIPATFAWWNRFRYGARTSMTLCWVLLLPGLLRAVLSPYRESLLTPVFVILLAALFAGRRLRIAYVFPGLLALFFASTILIGGYRQFLWEDATVKEAVEFSESGYTWEKSYDAKWVQTLNRFHGYDSLLLTVRYVPEYLPYSERTVVIDAILRGVVPRAIYEEKEGSIRGLDFGQSIWNYEDAYNQSTARIAPSMPGDLYEADGIAMVGLGAILWGLFLGLLEGWKARLSPKAASALTALFALHCFASVERDYAHVVSTTLQYLIVMFLVAKLVGVSTERNARVGLKRRTA